MALLAYLPLIMFVLALGIISSIMFPYIFRRMNNFINGFQLFNVVASYYCGITRSYPEFLFFMGLFLLISGIIAGRITKAEELLAR